MLWEAVPDLLTGEILLFTKHQAYFSGTSCNPLSFSPPSSLPLPSLLSLSLSPSHFFCLTPSLTHPRPRPLSFPPPSPPPFFSLLPTPSPLFHFSLSFSNNCLLNTYHIITRYQILHTFIGANGFLFLYPFSFVNSFNKY